MKIIGWEESKLNDLVNLWNKEIGTDFPMQQKLFKQNSFDDINVLYKGSFIALDDNDQVIGFVVAKQWKEKIDIGLGNERGWIQALLVDSLYHDKGIGTMLYNHAEEYLRSNGVQQIQLCGDPFHFFPGIPKQYKSAIEWAEKLGYEQKGYSYDLINQLSKKYEFPKDDSVTYSILKEEERDDLISFFDQSFPGRWKYETIKYFERHGNGREFVVAKKNNQIIGFCRINDSKSPYIAQNVYWSPLFDYGIGGIGPLGIAENEQKQGYGLAIVQAAIAILQNDRNVEAIVIDWTGILDFYAKLDFSPWKKYVTYMKTIE